MKERYDDARLDAELRSFLELRAADVAGVRSASSMAEGIARNRGALPAWRLRPTLAWMLVAVALLALLIGATLLTGGQRLADTSPVPTAVPEPSTPPGMPVADADQGMADSPIGHIAWDRIDHPFAVSSVVDAPDGLLAWDASDPGRIWRSTDGLAWTQEPWPLADRKTIGEHTDWSLDYSGADYWVRFCDPWEWSGCERLFRSSDTKTWSEVDEEALLGAFALPDDPAFAWTVRMIRRPIGAGGRTVIPAEVQGELRVADLLGLAPEIELEWPDDLGFEGRSDFEVDVVRYPGAEPAIPVARLRFAVVEPNVRIFDSDRGTILAEIDASRYGRTADLLMTQWRAGGTPAIDLTSYAAVTPTGFLPISGPGPTGTLLPIGDRVVALDSWAAAPGDASSITTWSLDATNTWQRIETTGLPTVSFRAEVFARSGGDTASVSVLLRRFDTPRTEMWVTSDGSHWTRLTVFPEGAPVLTPLAQLSSGAYLAMTEVTHRLYVSPTGERWTAVDEVPQLGGQDSVVTGTAAFIGTMLGQTPVTVLHFDH